MLRLATLAARKSPSRFPSRYSLLLFRNLLLTISSLPDRHLYLMGCSDSSTTKDVLLC